MDRLATLLAMAREKPDDPFLIFALALEYKTSGNQAESRAYFDRLVYEFSDYVPAYYQYGKMEEETGDLAKAITLYTKGIEISKAAGDQKTVRELQQAIDMMDE
jgi:tetratricopeptide (TPR) repeat protein